ncbi:MAG: DUF2341 domain-containing protein [Fibrobacterota bacterium]|nr:DUF2341 domain-containing protein [Fibrobacterota bacterium]
MTLPGLRKIFFAATLGLSAWMFHGCGSKVALGGDATETGNARVAGQVVKGDGLPIAGVEVFILTSDFNPVNGGAVPDSQKDTTDEDGRYRFTRLEAGSYNMQFHDQSGRTRSLVYGIKLAADSVIVPKDTLHAPGVMSVPLPETLDSGLGYVYIPGTTFRARVNSEIRITGKVLLDSLPQGLMPTVVYTKGDEDSRPIVLATDVAIRKSEVTYVNSFATWSKSAKLVLNTTGTGIAISKDQRDFPLLVRLSAPGFDFSKAAAGGADLRFSRQDGMPLSREIETWDARAGKADVWVRVDTVRAGSASQFINMHWGKQDASSGRMRPVFDTVAGFAGVWHLSEEAADTTANGLFKDATGAGSHGNDRVKSISRAGIIGAGHGLDSGDYIESPKVSTSLMLDSSFTISLWYKTTGKKFGYLGGELMNVGDNYGLRVYKDSILHLWFWPPDPPSGSKVAWFEISVKGTAFNDGNWHLVTGTFDGSVLRLYVDGDEAVNRAAPGVVGFQFPLNFTFGKHGNGKLGHEFEGGLDEAQVHSIARDADWIRMSFGNQRTGSGFPAMVGF